MGQSTGLLVKAKIVIGVCYLALYTQPLLAQAVDPVVITATRVPEPLDRLPAMLSVVSGRELIDRNADDMAGALSLVAGAEARYLHSGAYTSSMRFCSSLTACPGAGHLIRPSPLLISPA